MNSPFRFLLFLVFSFFAIEFYQDSHRDYMVKQEGEEVVALVDGVPACGNASTVKILIDNKPYQLRIAKVDCIQGEYARGQRVKVFYSYALDAAVTPDANVKVSLGLSIAFFIVPLGLFFSLVSPVRKGMRK